jgi:hypothetical protein
VRQGGTSSYIRCAILTALKLKNNCNEHGEITTIKFFIYLHAEFNSLRPITDLAGIQNSNKKGT